MTHFLPASRFVPYEPTPRQREILEHASQLVQETGLAHLTLRRVAERVGFTEAAIYRHFPNKAALVDALVRTLGSRLLEPIRALAADAALPPAERLQRMVRHHAGVLRATRGLPILLVAEGLATGDDELMARLRTIISAYFEALAGVLAALRLPTTVPPAQQALLFFGLPAALALQLRAFPDLALTDEQVDDLVHYYVRALTGAPPAAPEATP